MYTKVLIPSPGFVHMLSVRFWEFSAEFSVQTPTWAVLFSSVAIMVVHCVFCVVFSKSERDYSVANSGGLGQRSTAKRERERERERE